MGLDTSHNCWHGPYSSFGDWRRKLAQVAGYGDLHDYIGFNGDRPWPENGDALQELLNHSDCDGEIAANVCAPLADRMEQLMPSMRIAGEYYAESTQQFIDGLRAAAAANEPVEFH